jgi:hypothetical protein
MATTEAKSVDAFPSYRGRLLPRDGVYVGRDAAFAKRFAGLYGGEASSKMPQPASLPAKGAIA